MMDHLNEPVDRALPADGDPKLESVLRTRTAQLEERNRELDVFTREAAHELRTPIAQLIGITERMIDHHRGDAAPQLGHWLQLQLKVARHMDETLRAMLDLARSSIDMLSMEDIDVTALCHTLLRDLPDEDRCAPVQWRIAPRMDAYANRAALALAMRNLLSNAVKYTREVERPVVSVQACTIGSWRRISVADNGLGFDEAKAARLFEPFVRLHTDSQCGGIGLGLSIVKRVAERHGGFVDAIGVPQHGARFEISLRTRPRDSKPTQ